mgnify:CR=1 FL=1
MTASDAAFRPRGGGVLLVLALIVGALVFLSPLALFLDEPANVPVAQPVNEHAIEKHAESVDIYDRYTKGEYKCLRVYRNLADNRLLWRFTYSDTSLEGGMITTVSGTAVTAYMAQPVYWGNMICRDGYNEVMLVTGECPPEMGCN